MGFLMIRIETPALSAAQLTQKLSGLDSTKPLETLQDVKNLLDAVTSGQGATIDLATRVTTEAINASGTGSAAASLNLL